MVIRRLGGLIFSDTHKSSEIDLLENIKELKWYLDEIDNHKKTEAMCFYIKFLYICDQCISLEYNFSVNEETKDVAFAMYVTPEEYLKIKSDVTILATQSDSFSIGKMLADEWQILYKLQ